MKKVILIALAIVLLFGFTACGTDDASEDVAISDELSENPYLVLVNKDKELPSDW